MVQEIRKIIFSSEELAEAFEAYARTTPDFLPAGKIASCAAVNEDGNKVVVKMDTPDARELTYAGADALHPLIRFCLENNVMLPRDGRKTFMVADGKAILAVTLNLDVDLAFVEAPLTSDLIDQIKDDG